MYLVCARRSLSQTCAVFADAHATIYIYTSSRTGEQTPYTLYTLPHSGVVAGLVARAQGK